MTICGLVLSWRSLIYCGLTDATQGGHQEDAEEFLGFYLDTLEDELLHILDSLTPPAQPVKNEVAVEEHEEEQPRDDSWLEVGRKNRLVVTSTVSFGHCLLEIVLNPVRRRRLQSPLSPVYSGAVSDLH